VITDDLAPLRHDLEPWLLTGFEFRCVWEALGLDHLPFPLAYRHRQRFMNEVEADRREALARVRPALNPRRVRILEALRFPAFLVHGFGRITDDDNDGDDDPGKRLYRLFGVIGTTGYCAVITQDPSRQTIFGEDVQITGCVNVDFPKVVLGALPDYQPGRESRRSAAHSDETPADAFGGAVITGSILLSGSADFTHDYELRNAHHLTLVDVADDGAYLVNEGADWYQIVPATVPNLLDVFSKVEGLQLKVADRLAAARAE
jgi:hypothetical protein